jgi:single-stranded DNA-specific DHH superfamily exonuclease
MDWEQGVDKFSNLLLETKGKDIWLLHHADCDGCVGSVFCNYVIARFGLNLNRRIWILSAEYDLRCQKKLIQEHKPEILIFLDLDVVSDGVLLGEWKRGVKRILIYDHHKVDGQELDRLLKDHTDVFYFNPRLLSQPHSFPASYFGYSLFRKFQNQDSRTWLMGAGLIGDRALDEDPEIKKMVLAEYQMLSKSENSRSLQEITFMINAGYFHRDSRIDDVSFELAYNAFLQNNPFLFFDLSFHLVTEINRRKSEIDVAVAKACQQADEIVIKDENLPLIIYILESEHYISGLVASALSARFKDEIIVVGQSWGDKFSFEIRRGSDCNIDITRILKTQRNYYRTLSAGGHPPACGALIIKEDRDKFLDTFRKAFFEII